MLLYLLQFEFQVCNVHQHLSFAYTHSHARSLTDFILAIYKSTCIRVWMCVYMLRSNVLIRSFNRVKFVELFFCFDDYDDDDDYFFLLSILLSSVLLVPWRKKIIFFCFFFFYIWRRWIDNTFVLFCFRFVCEFYFFSIKLCVFNDLDFFFDQYAYAYTRRPIFFPVCSFV